ncbi:MAG: gliding motility-associated C-terminal domain-containing protein [Chitinophagaceae bacterium]|nr:gliding motility-associated C-terminal domain-containing protein [Chitinophagaceae bacterium]
MVKDANNCTRDTTIIINSTSPVEATYAITPATCNGGSNGGLVVTTIGNFGPYQYSVDGGTTYQTGNTFSLAAGIYYVVIKDATNCTKDTTIQITEPSALVTAAVITPATCNGAATGIITINQSGGTIPYEYSIDGGTTYQPGNLFIVAAGTYTVRIRDANGCTKDTTLVVTQPDPILSASVVTPVTCNGGANGTIVINPSGGTIPYEYSIDGGTTYQPGNSFTLAAGTYTFRVKDANNCTKDTTLDVTQPDPILSPSVVTAVTCSGGANGTIVINPAGGAVPYEYSIDGGTTYQPGNSFTVAAGTYTIRIKDANGCTKDTTLNVTQPAPLLSPAVITAVTCNGGTNGTIVINPAGGAVPYEYSMDGGATYQPGNSFTVAAGTYTIRIKDANSCTKDTTVDVSQPAPIITPSVVTAVSCNGGNNGSIVMNPAGGAVPYEYSIDGGIIYQPGNSFTVVAGTYTVRIKDANGCTKDTTIDVTQPAPIQTPSVVTAVTCNGGTNGVIVINPAGGAVPYEYSIDGGTTYQPGNSFTVAAGVFTIRIKDANGCTKDTSIQVTQPAAIVSTAVVTSTKCNGSADGTIVMNPSGGAVPYEYSIDGGTTYQPGNSFTVAAGTYAIRIKDANGCTKDTSITVGQPAALVATATTSNASCSNLPNGQITAGATGGTGTYTYSTDGTTFQSATSFTTGQGSFTVTVKDANGCTATAPAAVGFTFDLFIQGRADSIICDNGRVKLNTISNAQTFSWNNANSLDDATLVSPFASPSVTTDYILTATLGNCTLKDTVRIVVTAAPTVFAGNNVQIVKGEDAQLIAVVTNTASFVWSPTTYLNNPGSLSPISVMPQETTTYTLTVTNTEGCSKSDEVTVTVLPYCIKVKNAFTPNGDGVNDTWMIYDQYDCLKNIKVQVFNRYGSKVFESTNYRNDWKGTFGGHSLPDATYYYVIDYTLLSGRVLQVRGDVTILR